MRRNLLGKREIRLDANGNVVIPAKEGTELAPDLHTAHWTLPAGWRYLTTPDRLDKNGEGDGEASVVPAASLSIVAGTMYKLVVTIDSITPGAEGIYMGIGAKTALTHL